jgi:chromosome segregation ATPase
MSNDEIERAMDFLLKSQANLDVRIEQTNEQLAQTNEQLRQLAEHVGALTDTQNQFIQVVTRTFEAQAQINESLRAGQARTDEALARLAEAQAHTDRRLDALIDIVQGRINGQ